MMQACEQWPDDLALAHYAARIFSTVTKFDVMLTKADSVHAVITLVLRNIKTWRCEKDVCFYGIQTIAHLAQF